MPNGGGGTAAAIANRSCVVHRLDETAFENPSAGDPKLGQCLTVNIATHLLKATASCCGCRSAIFSCACSSKKWRPGGWRVSNHELVSWLTWQDMRVRLERLAVFER